MKHLALSIFLILFFTQCSKNRKYSSYNTLSETNIIEVDSSTVKPLKIKTITNIDEIKKLRAEILREKRKQERAQLDSLPLHIRLVKNDSLVYDTINKIITGSNYNSINQLLTNYLKYRPYNHQIKHQKTNSHIMSLIKNPNTEEIGIKVSGILKLDYNNSFSEKYIDSKSRHKASYFYWLGVKGESEKVIDDFLAQLKKKSIDKEKLDKYVLGVSKFASSSNEAIRKKAITSLLTIYNLKWISISDIIGLKENSNITTEVFVKTLMKHGGTECKKIINICLKHNLFLNEYYKYLSRLKDKKLTTIFLKKLSSKETFLESLSSAPLIYASNNDSIIPIKIIQNAVKLEHSSDETFNKIKYILKKMDALVFMKNANSYIKNDSIAAIIKSIGNSSKAIPQSHDEIIAELFNLKITDSLTVEEIKNIESQGVFHGRNALIKNILYHNHQLISIDKYYSQKPIDYSFILNGINNFYKSECQNIIVSSSLNQQENSIILLCETKAVIIYPDTNSEKIDMDLIVKAYNDLLTADKIHVLQEDEEFIELFYGTYNDLNSIKSIFKSNQSTTLPI